MDRTKLNRRLVERIWVCYEWEMGVLIQLFPTTQAAVLSYLIWAAQTHSYELEHEHDRWMLLPTDVFLKHLGISRMTLYRNLKNLEERGIIEIELRSPSRRSQCRRIVRLHEDIFHKFSSRRIGFKKSWEDLMRSYQKLIM